MASSPATTTKSSVPSRDQQWAEAYANALADGYSHSQIVKKLAGRDEKKAKTVRRRIRNLSRYNPEMATTMASVARGEAIMNLIPAVQALSRRAARGRTDSIKLLFELTGFHSPRVQHDHSGEIEIKLTGMHRPPRTVDQLGPPVVDAEVVED